MDQSSGERRTGPTVRRLGPDAALAATGFLVPVLAVATPLALAPLLGIAAVAVLALGGYRALPRLHALRSLVVVLGLLCLWGTLSGLWSILPLHSFLEGLRFTLIVSAGLVLVAAVLALDPPGLQRVQRGLFWGFVLALLLLAVPSAVRILMHGTPPETPLGRWTRMYTRFDRGSTTVALMLWPVMLGLIARGRRLLLVDVLLPAAGVIFALPSRAAMLSLVVGALVLPIAWVAPRVTVAALGAGFVALVVAMPVLPLESAEIARIHQAAPWIPASGFHRLAIWHFGAERIAERPVLGWGLDASRDLPHGSDMLDDPNLPQVLIGYGQNLPLHPHNAPLQWRLELGIPGTILGTLAVLWILAKAFSLSASNRATRAISIAVIPAALVVALLSYGFWQAWWQSCLWFVATFVLAALRNAPAGAGPDRR